MIIPANKIGIKAIVVLDMNEIGVDAVIVIRAGETADSTYAKYVQLMAKRNGITADQYYEQYCTDNGDDVDQREKWEEIELEVL